MANYLAVGINSATEVVRSRRIQRELRLHVVALLVTPYRVGKRPLAPRLDGSRLTPERADQLSNFIGRCTALFLTGTIAENPNYLVISQLVVVFLDSIPCKAREIRKR